MVPSPFHYVPLLSLLFTPGLVFGEELGQTCIAEGTCIGVPAPEGVTAYVCVDEEDECEYWASLEPSECDENREYMGEFCRKACNMCNEPVKIGVPQNKDFERSSEVEEVVNKTIEYMSNEVMVEPKYEKVRFHCKNYEEDCSIWAVVGECETNREYMISNCAPACQLCDKLLFENRCPWDKNAKGVWEHGDLNRMFEKITTFPAYEKYEPRVLSRPYYAKGDSEEKGVDYQIGPWVVLLENFLSQQECDTLIDLGHEEGYERSSDVGEMNFDGTFEDDVNEGRTSTNAWCEDVCRKDPIAQSVEERIEHVTGIPKNNSEYLQLLRYEPGQKYDEHHDYIDFETKRPQGVRLMTLYLYLNDVEAGGGTKFPQLDLTVMPKRGRALLWPSVLNEDPNSMDDRTEHQALPVERGIKYGANAWMHQRDFKTPNEAGCS